MSLALVLAQSGGDFFKKRTGESCIAKNGFCPEWIADNYTDYIKPFFEHVALTAVSVAIGFVVATTLALVAHRRQWLTGPIVGVTGALYTIPSVAAFFLLQPITGRGNLTAVVALVSYTLLILFRNITTGLRNVPEETLDAGRGMGLTPNQLLWRVEIPMATPEILAGLRIAVTTTIGLATLAVFAGADGLGQFFASGDQLQFKSNVALAGGLAVLLAAISDLLILAIQRLITPWQRAGR